MIMLTCGCGLWLAAKATLRCLGSVVRYTHVGEAVGCDVTAGHHHLVTCELIRGPIREDVRALGCGFLQTAPRKTDHAQQWAAANKPSGTAMYSRERP